jgi:hypothetical protein
MWIIADSSAESESIKARHCNVQNRHIWMMFKEQLQSVVSVSSLDHLMIVSLQRATYQSSDARLIISNQYPCGQRNDGYLLLSDDQVSRCLGSPS